MSPHPYTHTYARPSAGAIGSNEIQKRVPHHKKKPHQETGGKLGKGPALLPIFLFDIVKVLLLFDARLEPHDVLPLLLQPVLEPLDLQVVRFLNVGDGRPQPSNFLEQERYL